MRRHGHDRARAVAGQDIVRDEDRDPFAVDRVDRLRAQGETGLLAVGRQALDLGAAPSLHHVGLHLGLAIRVGQPGDEWMFGREDHERRAEQRVRAGREDAQRVATGLVLIGGDFEVDLGALGPADPVGLHDLDRLRPVQPGKVQQFVGVGGRAQEPLLQVALLDRGAAPPTAPLRALDLLAGQRPIVGAPVHRGHRTVSEPRLQETQEEPLVPLVVLGIGGHHLRLPGERRAHRAQLPAHVLDVLHRPRERVAAVLDGGVLCGQAEGIETDREEHVVAVHPAEARQGIGRRLDVPVTDVQVTRRVGVHRQQVVLGP